MRKPPKLLNVEAGRGIAATLVVATHASGYYFGNGKYWNGKALFGFFAWGSAGVEFFFVLSGFIIATVHWDDIGHPGRVKRFLKRRFTRLYPFYWACLLAAILVFAAFPEIGLSKNRDLMNVLSSTVLVGSNPHNAVIFPAWSLYYEIAFYALAAVAIWKPRIGLGLMMVWLASSLLDGFINPNAFYLVNPLNVLFPLGIACALWLRHRSVPAPGVVLAGGAALFLAAGLYVTYVAGMPTLLFALSFGTGAALLLLGGVELERSGRWRAPRWAVMTGQASYSIYLTHIFVLACLAKLARHFGLTSWMPTASALVLLILGGVLGGVVIHVVIERPAIRRTRAWMEPAAQRLPEAPTLVSPGTPAPGAEPAAVLSAP